MLQSVIRLFALITLIQCNACSGSAFWAGTILHIAHRAWGELSSHERLVSTWYRLGIVFHGVLTAVLSYFIFRVVLVECITISSCYYFEIGLLEPKPPAIDEHTIPVLDGIVLAHLALLPIQVGPRL